MKFLIIPNEKKQAAMSFLPKLTEYINSKGHIVTSYSESENIDMIITLGGDGTLIRSVRKLKRFDIPVFGINFGSLGFLTGCEPEDAFSCIDKLIGGDYFIMERGIIAADIISSSGEKRKECFAVNEIAVSRGAVPNPARLEIAVNGNPLYTLSGDGVIFATPTGSTAYSLSAGGPVVSALADVYIVNPICQSAASLSAAVVLCGNDVTTMRGSIEERAAARLVLCSDSSEICELQGDETLIVYKAPFALKTPVLKKGSGLLELQKRLKK